MMKIDVNTAGLMMDCMGYAFVAAVTKERGTAPSDEEIHSAVKSLMTLYCRHEGISAPIDEVPSEYTGIPACPYLSPEDVEENEDEDEDGNEDEDEEEASYSDFRNALENLLDEYDLHSLDEDVDYFVDHLYYE